MSATGVLLMTYGSAPTSADVPAFLQSVRGGRPASDELIREFQRRYELIGFSPLVRITLEQASALESALNRRHGAGTHRVAAGMLHSQPEIASALRSLTDQGIDEVVALIMSPQWSPIIMGGYKRALDAALADAPGVHATMVKTWYDLPSFIDALSEKVTASLDRFPADVRDTVPVILTAHSLPKSVVDREPEYLEQLMETVHAVVRRAGLKDGRWAFAYQSAGHTPEEWLKPDLKDLLPGLRSAGHEDVLVVPVQFLADHLEILYDIDVAAREEAESAGMRFHRIELMNTSKSFINCLADVVESARVKVGGPLDG